MSLLPPKVEKGLRQALRGQTGRAKLKLAPGTAIALDRAMVAQGSTLAEELQTLAHEHGLQSLTVETTYT